MRYLAMLVGALIIVAGVAGIIAPEPVVRAGQYAVTPTAIYLVAGLRVVCGVVLLLAAPQSRAPKTLRSLGVIVMVAGVATPLLGVNRSHILLNWWSVQGAAFTRAIAILALSLGVFVVYAVAPRTARRLI